MVKMKPKVDGSVTASCRWEEGKISRSLCLIFVDICGDESC